MIVLIDGQRVCKPEDVLNHVQVTDLVFINVRTGLPQSGRVVLP